MMDSSDAVTEAAREGRQLRPGLWQTINKRYPGSLLTKEDAVPLAQMHRPLAASRLTFISTSGVQPKGTLPFDVVHPIGDFSFRRVPSTATPDNLEIHQLKYPTTGARRDLNVIFPIERLQELAAEGVIGGLTPHFFTFIGYTIDPERFERTLAEELAEAVVAEGADIALAAPA